MENLLKVILRDAYQQLLQDGRFCAENMGQKTSTFDFGTTYRIQKVVSSRKTIYQKTQNLMENIMLFKFLKNIE